MTHTDSEIEEWIHALVNEARRDLVFLWNIEQGRFGGQGRRPDDASLEQVVAGLVRCGCIVGFGDPDLESWRPLQLKNDVANSLPAQIVHMLRENRNENAFITFACRD